MTNLFTTSERALRLAVLMIVLMLVNNHSDVVHGLTWE